GRDPFAAVTVHDRHRRLRIEQELREAQIRMRRAVTDAGAAREAVAGGVTRKLKQVRAPLRSLLALKGIACAEGPASVVARCAETWKVDLAPLRAAREAPEAAYTALAEVLSKAIDEVNAMEETPTRS